MCEEMNVTFLGKIPIDPLIGQCCDEGKSFVKEFPNSPACIAYNDIISSKYFLIIMSTKFLFYCKGIVKYVELNQDS